MIKKIAILVFLLMVIGKSTVINASYVESEQLTNMTNYLGTVEFNINENGTKTFVSLDGEIIEICCEEIYTTYSNAGLTVTNKKYTVKKGSASFTFRITTKAIQYDEDTWYTQFRNVEAMDVSGATVATTAKYERIIRQEETATLPAKASVSADYTSLLGDSTIGVEISIKNAIVTLDTFGS
ncbi:MAG: hypothetical protein IJO27_02880 [Bacilli bacterium]|nr:hypothetical protein [Bacilli bacterium]